MWDYIKIKALEFACRFTIVYMFTKLSLEITMIIIK